MTAGILAEFRLDQEMERLAPDPDAASGRRAETLLKTDQLRVVLITMRSGAELQEHTAPGQITIQPLRGRFQVDVEGNRREVGPHQLIAVDAGAPHSVRADADGAFLLTIAAGG